MKYTTWILEKFDEFYALIFEYIEHGAKLTLNYTNTK